MTKKTGFWASAALLLALVALLLPGCTPAKADPLELTYYYLPG